MVSRIKTIAYYFHSPPDNTLAYHRVVGPAKHLGLKILYGFSYHNSAIDLELIPACDVVVIQRDFPRFYEEYNKIIALAHNEGKPVILDIDDLLLELPEDHPNRNNLDYTDALLPTFQACLEVDAITVATKQLKQYFEAYNKNVFVLPNFLNDELWDLRPPLKTAANKPFITIGYMGTHTHAPDLVLFTPVLLELFSRYPENLRFICWGVEPPQELIKLPNVRHIPFQNYQYPTFVEFFQQQSTDVFVAPLVDHIFNSCKSSLKFLEYTALGAPGVYANLPPYATVVTQGYDGFLAGSSLEWLEYLIELIENPDLRYQIACNAQEKVRKEWLLSKNAQRWLETYQSIIEKFPSNHDRHLLKIVQSIASQTVEKNRVTSRQLASTQEQIIHLIQQFEKERLQEIEYETQLQNLKLNIQELEHHNQDLALQKSDLEEKVQRLSVTLQEIYGSTTWQLALSLRRMILIFFPSGSWRKRILKKLIHALIFLGRIKHYAELRKNLKLIKSSSLFDADWYLAQYPDVQQAGIDPARHFLLYGGFEGRDPSPGFSTQWYLETYKDVAGANINPLIHYIHYGSAQNRKPKPKKD